MGHIEIMDGQPIEVEQVNTSERDVDEIYRELGVKTTIQPRQRSIKRQSKAPERYVRTIPLPWVFRASRLPGKALHVGIVLWYHAGVSKSKTVKLTRSRLRQFGIHHETGRRGLQALRKANLVSVDQSGKRSPYVTVPLGGAWQRTEFRPKRSSKET